MVMKKKYSKRQLYSGMQGKVERQAQKAYELRVDKYAKKAAAFDKYLKDLEKKGKDAVEQARKLRIENMKNLKIPKKARVRKIRRGIKSRSMKY